jgi:hypothetical protein
MTEPNPTNPRKSANQSTIKRRSSRTVIIMIVITMILVMVLKTGMIFCVLAMLPAIVAYYFDRSPTQYIFHTVFACNLAATLPFIGQMLRNNVDSVEIQAVMTNGLHWLIIYGAAGFGWLLVFTAPVFAKGLINMMHQRQIHRLERTQNRITSEWGKEVEKFHAEKMNPSWNPLPAIRADAAE